MRAEAEAEAETEAEAEVVAEAEKEAEKEAEVEVEAEAVVEMLAAEAGLRCARRGRSQRVRRCYTPMARTVAWPKCPGSQPPVRPPTAQEGQPLAQGYPPSPRGAPSPRGCRSGLCPTKFADLAAFDHSRQGSAELLRTYGFVEPSPYTRVAITLEELLNTATRLRATRGRGGRAPLPASRAHHRAIALERAGLLPAGGIFLVGAAAEVDPGLLTAVQVLAMTD